MRGKRHKPDVQAFQFNLMDNLLQLHSDLANRIYHHGPYERFRVNDPKPREIHKANVRDRLVHRAVYRILYWPYHQRFIADSFSCRFSKGTHKALNRYRAFSYRVSRNHTRTGWVLKCDIKKFFASIDHQILFSVLRERLSDQNTFCLLTEIIGSFYSTRPGAGLPLGNLTSQLLANIYLDQLDQFIKHQLKIKHYIRYADDFVIPSSSKPYLERLVPVVSQFLLERLKLMLHPQKVFIKTLASGVDFLGWVHFPDHRVLRTSTKKRMLRHLFEVRLRTRPETVSSYLGMLGHGNTNKLVEMLKTVTGES